MTQNLTAKNADVLLKEGKPLTDFSISGEVKIEVSEVWKKDVVIENCTLDSFSGNVTQFKKHVKLINCHFKKCQFTFTHFPAGLTIENCTFDDYLDFQAGGHNKQGGAITLTNNTFKGFVNFFDCSYEGEVIVKDNKFQKGTNLLGEPFNIPVTFKIAPIVENNSGDLNINTEGQ